MTKPELAVRMMTRILAQDAPIAWVAADEVYGQDRKFRTACLHRNVGYVVAVPCNEHIPTTRMGTRRIDTLAAQAPPEAWTRISAGRGTKGPRLYDWAAVRISAWWDQQEGVGHWALIRRSITDPTELAFYLCAGPAGTPIEELVRVAGARWAIEECFQAAKNHTGLDQYEVRSHPGRALAGGNTVEIIGRDRAKAEELAATLGGARTRPFPAGMSTPVPCGFATSWKPP
jgi:SRSO17 transposase